MMPRRKPDPDLAELARLVREALALADDLDLWTVGIALDRARIGVARLTGEQDEHPTLQ